MSDDGNNIIDFTDLTWDPAGFYRFDLTSSRGDTTLSEGLGLVRLFGHGHDVSSLHLGSTNYGLWVWDWDIVGDVSYGVTGSGLHNSIFYEVDVINSNIQGYSISGNNITIAYPDISNIGSDSYSGIVGGMALQGSNYSVHGATISGLHSQVETYAVGFNSTGATGNVLSSSTLNGAGSTGWSFGVWSSSAPGGVTIDDVSVTNWAWASGGKPVNVQNSTLNNASNGNNVTLVGANNTVTESDKDDPSYTGGSIRNVFIGDSSDQTFAGGAGSDVIEGGFGNDTFVFLQTTNEVDVLIGFNQGDDLIKFDVASPGAWDFLPHATYDPTAGPSVFYDSYSDFMFYDSDGNGGAAAVKFAYLPGASLTSSDLIFI